MNIGRTVLRHKDQHDARDLPGLIYVGGSFEGGDLLLDQCRGDGKAACPTCSCVRVPLASGLCRLLLLSRASACRGGKEAARERGKDRGGGGAHAPTITTHTRTCTRACAYTAPARTRPRPLPVLLSYALLLHTPTALQCRHSVPSQQLPAMARHRAAAGRTLSLQHRAHDKLREITQDIQPPPV